MRPVAWKFYTLCCATGRRPAAVQNNQLANRVQSQMDQTEILQVA